jgi:hypothetical protein
MFSHALPFVFDTVGLLPHHILEQGDPPWVIAHTSKTCNMSVVGIKKAKLDTIKQE